VDVIKQQFPGIAGILEAGLKTRHYLGGQIYVSIAGEEVLDIAFGESRPGQELRRDHLMLWLSSTKPVTAVAIAQQYQRGKLDWNDPVAKFIPEFAQKGKEQITIRHLLTHTAGFRTADRLPDELPWEQMVEEICVAPLEPGWVPGGKAGYQIASSWYILGEIVSRLTGKAYPDYVRANVFLPLGMVDSWIGMPSEEFRRYGERIAPMYATDIGQPREVPLWNTQGGCAICRPASNGRGTASDLGRLYQALLRRQPELMLKDATVGEITSRQRVGMFDQTFHHVIDWGLGFIINSNRYGPESVPYGYGRLASDETFGHSGAQSSCAFADPRHRLVVVWILNGMPGERPHQRRARDLNTALYQDLQL